MADSIKDKHLTGDDLAKLKSAVNAIVVSLQHQDDIRAQMGEIAAEVAEELEIKKSEIMDAARTLYKQNFAEKQAKQDAVGELLGALGYELDSDDE